MAATTVSKIRPVKSGVTGTVRSSREATKSTICIAAAATRTQGTTGGGVRLRYTRSVDKGPLYTWNEGKGHNVTAIKLPDGRYAVLVSETVPASIFIAADPNGPFEYQGHVEINTNGHNTSGVKLESNMSICMREDSSFLIVTRNGFILHSTSGILGPYLVKSDKIWPMNLPGYNTANWEDPVLWRTAKSYYCTVNSWSSKKAIYMTSDDGITNWKYAGEAYSPLTPNVFRYTDGTVNTWTKLERPGFTLKMESLRISPSPL